MTRVSIIIPTLNALSFAPRQMKAFKTQRLQPLEVLVLDSESDDATPLIFQEAGAKVITVKRQNFHHATVRNQGAKLACGDILVFMTQDALPHHPDWLERLTLPLASAAASFARQIPYPGASPLERFARHTNYPASSRIVSGEDIDRLGIRAFFFSNSCSAVRRDAFEEVGGFPAHTIMNEDMLFAARLLHAGHTIAYAADALVQHSHRYSLKETFRRYFDIGVVFSQAEAELARMPLGGEGLSYVRKLLGYLAKRGDYPWIPVALAESAAKWSGLSLGKRYRLLPPSLVRRLSMHSGYWSRLR